MVTREASVKTPHGIIHCELLFSETAPYRIALIEATKEIESAIGPDLFEALVELRRKLEGRSYMICCQGARRDVYPSGMSRQMGGGRLAYDHSTVITSQPGRRKVDIFDPAACSEVGTVEEQIERNEDRLRRLRAGLSTRPPESHN